MPFSSKSTQAIADFTDNLRMGHVPPAADGSYSFAFERAGLLSFAPSADGQRAIMSLKAATPPRLTADDLIGFLRIAQRDPVTQTPISAGIVGGALVLAANIPDEDFDLQQIELCLDRLIALHAGTG